LGTMVDNWCHEKNWTVVLTSEEMKLAWLLFVNTDEVTLH